MKALITGGNGFIGQKLAERLLKEGLPTVQGVSEPITSLVLTDVTPAPTQLIDDRVKTDIADISAEGEAARLIGNDTDAIFHLAAVVSSQAEADFDMGLRVNLGGTQALLAASRAAGNCPVFVHASSCAIYGGSMPDVLDDSTQPYPQSSYGTQKLIGEILLNDYSRKGFINGFALRFPTVVVRPGKPNAAASSFASSIIREPLNGQPTNCPIRQNTAVWITSPSSVSANVRHAAGLDSKSLPNSRSIPLPGMTITVDQMLASLKSVAGESAVKLVTNQTEEAIEKIVYSWPTSFNTPLADSLGFSSEQNFDNIIQEYIDEYLD